MDGQLFDRFTRTFAGGSSRRQAIRALAGIAAAGLWPLPAAAQGNAACAEGMTSCPGSGGCVDLQTDLNNCGACGNACESGLVPVACRNGECVRANCPPQLEYCGLTDGCRDLSSDPAHCGACGNACASGLCQNGVCATAGTGTCQPGQKECDGVCVDTCCNNNNCGACGNVCNPPFTCFEGVCDCPRGDCCAEGEVICDGACVATCCNNDHCGACGNACKPPLTCFEGKCSCPSGNCPPVTLPNTGSGSRASAGSGVWALLATASGAAAVALRRWQRSGEEPRASLPRGTPQDL